MGFVPNILSSILSTASFVTLYDGSSLINGDKSVSDSMTIPDHQQQLEREENIYQYHWDLYPKSYTVHKIPSPLLSVGLNRPVQIPKPAFAIDGNIDKDVWRNVPWSDSFGDIQGIDEPEPKNVIPTTKFKAMYDDSFLYIAAILHPVEGLPTSAYFTERNSPIYQQDSDFEVFIDLDHTNHMYKELEVNAINTVWNLLLDMPYYDGGQEHSGRIAKIGEKRYYDVLNQQTATKVIAGIINDESNSHIGALWSVEMAMSYTDILSNTTLSDNPKYSPAGTSWRVNFSRVEKQGKINWTWQPQIRWNPESWQYNGIIAMHMPDAWGYFYFSDDDSRSTSFGPYKDPLWPEKLTAMTIYYALHYYKNQNGHFIDNLSELALPMDVIVPFCCQIQLVSKRNNGEGFLVQVNKKSDSKASVVQLFDDRLLQIVHAATSNE